jgi:hypothetical protein
MNIVILVSVISIGNSGVYGGSRTLTALAEQGYAPKIFAYIDRSGRPLFSTIAIIACGLLAYMNLAATGETIFNWLLALSGLAALFTWGSICLAHIRFRAAWKYHGHTVDEIPFQAIFGVYGSWIGLTMIFLVLVAQVSPATPRNMTMSLTIDSSTSPSGHLAVASILPQVFSKSCSPFPSSSFSGLLDLFGKEDSRASLRWRRSMWMLEGVRLTGRGSTATRHMLLASLCGDEQSMLHSSSW